MMHENENGMINPKKITRRENFDFCRRKREIAGKNLTFAGENMLSEKPYLFPAKKVFSPVKVILSPAFINCTGKKCR